MLRGKGTGLFAIGLVALALVPTAPASQVAQTQALQTGILAQMNALRASHHLKPLVLSTSLSSAAVVHDKEMAARGYFAHDSSNGGAFWKRIQHYYRNPGYNYWAVGENLLWASPDVHPH